MATATASRKITDSMGEEDGHVGLHMRPSRTLADRDGA